MVPSNTEFDGEDEDVVIEGSELHEALSKMGYSDYEIVPISNEVPSDPVGSNKFIPKGKSKGWVSDFLFRKIIHAYRHMIKDSEALREELTVISEAQHLLDDHADLITSHLEEDRAVELGSVSRLLPYLRYAAVAAVGWYFIDRSKPITWLVTVPVLTKARFKYTEWRNVRKLKKLITEQTELYYNYKRALRILNHSFRMRTDAKQSGSKFVELGSEKLILLQPILEKTLKSMEIMSISYYETTLRMAKLLSGQKRKDYASQITYFDKENFVNCGEVTYNSLKQLCYKFILIQSEMLLTLAVLRHSDLDDICGEVNRGMRIDHTIEKLLELTTEHRMLMMKTVDSFHNHKLSAVKDKRRGFPGSKWQDLYVRLHLTSHKLERNYDTIASVLEDIENHLDRGTEEPELVGRLKTRLNDVCSDVDKIKDLVQLSGLIIYKMEQDLRGDMGDENNWNGGNGPSEISQRDIPIVKDTEPEIIDEVFEEYIRERYSEARNDEEGDGYMERSIKLDKLLSKNLMSELKEALVDKQKDTRERESRALKRMNRIPVKESDPENLGNGETDESSNLRQCLSPKPSNRVLGEQDVQHRELEGIPRPPPLPMPRQLNQLKRESEKIEEDEEDKRDKRFVPLISSRSIQLPLFLSNNEETFIGSGENSDAEEYKEKDENEEEDNEGIN